MKNDKSYISHRRKYCMRVQNEGEMLEQVASKAEMRKL